MKIKKALRHGFTLARTRRIIQGVLGRVAPEVHAAVVVRSLSWQGGAVFFVF